MLPTDLWRKWWILTRFQNGKPLTWGQHAGSPLTWHSRGRRWWYRRTLLDSISGWWYLDGREALVHTWKFTTWSKSLPMPIQFESTTPHSRRCPKVHRLKQHLQISWCHSIYQWGWYMQPGRYPWTLKETHSIVYKISLFTKMEH